MFIISPPYRGIYIYACAAYAAKTSQSVTHGQFSNDIKSLRVTQYSSQCTKMRHTWAILFLRGGVALIRFLSGFAYLISFLSGGIRFVQKLKILVIKNSGD